MGAKKLMIGKGLGISEDDRSFSTMINGDSWTVRIPLPEGRVFISRRISEYTGGFTSEQIGEYDYNYAKMLVTLTNVLSGYPDWWKGPSQCMDEKLLEELWGFYLESEENFRSRLKTLRQKGSMEKSESDA